MRRIRITPGSRTAPGSRVMRRWLALGCLILGGAAAANMADQGHRSQTGGIDLITYRTNVRDFVVITGSLPAGDAMAEADNVAVPTLTGMMLDRGTKTLDKVAIAERLDSIGAQISFAVGTQTLEIHAKCLKKDLPVVLSLLAEELKTPALSAAEFDKARQQLMGSLQESLQNPARRAQEAFGRAIFPEGHPNHPHSIDEYLAAAKLATIDEVKSFHARYVGPKHLTLVLVGDVPEPEIKREIAKDFSGWTGGGDYRHAATPAAADGPREIEVPLKDKPSASVILGQPTGLRYRDPDALALRVGTSILGQGFTGRLMHTVRDREGLTYGIGAAVTEDSIADGAWMISATFAPTLLDKGIASTHEVLDTWWQDGITEAELGARKQGIVGAYLVSLSTTAGLANAILASVQRGYDLGWLDGYPEAVKAMTRDRVNAAIRAHLDPSKMVLVEAGSVAMADAAPPTGTAPTGAPAPGAAAPSAAAPSAAAASGAASGRP